MVCRISCGTTCCCDYALKCIISVPDQVALILQIYQNSFMFIRKDDDECLCITFIMFPQYYVWTQSPLIMWQINRCKKKQSQTVLSFFFWRERERETLHSFYTWKQRRSVNVFHCGFHSCESGMYIWKFLENRFTANYKLPLWFLNFLNLETFYKSQPTTLCFYS